MVTPWDSDYIETKQIRQGKKRLHRAFQELAQWVNETYKVKGLNICYHIDRRGNEKRYQLHVIFEFQHEELLFRSGVLGNFHTDKQDAVALTFAEICRNRKPSLLDRLFKPEIILPAKNLPLRVVFDSFEATTRKEANLMIPDHELRKLQKALNMEQIWTIHRQGDSATFFFYTNTQVSESMKNGMKEQLTQTYFSLLKKYDEFNYFHKETFTIKLDSKENFDTNYEGSWFCYDR